MSGRRGPNRSLGAGECTGSIRDAQTERKMPVEDANWWLEIEVPDELLGYVAEKGSIAIDGISLTIASLRGISRASPSFPIPTRIPIFRVYAPWRSSKSGSRYTGQYVERLLEARRTSAVSRLNLQQLIEEGF